MSEKYTDHSARIASVSGAQLVRKALFTHRHGMRALLMRLSAMLGGPNPEALADALILVWQDTPVDLRSGDETGQVAFLLPTLVKMLTHIFESPS